MKLNKLYIIGFISMLGLFTACSEYEDTEEISPVVDLESVRFANDNSSVLEVIPATTEFSLMVVRDKSDEANDVSVTVLTTNDALSFPETVSFATGEDTTYLTVTFTEEAENDVVYSYMLELESDVDENPYKSESNIFGGTVTKTAYEDFGTAQFYDSFAFYKVAEVTLQQNTLDNNKYRITYPYSEGILEDAEWGSYIGGSTQTYIAFTIEDGLVTWDDYWYTNLFYSGTSGYDIKAYLPSALASSIAGDDSRSVVVEDEDGNIKYFDLYPYFYVDGLGGYGENEVILAFPGYDYATEAGLSIYSE